MSDIDWGDAPTWIAAVFAGGAAWFAGMTLRSQRRQLREQQQFIGEQSQNLRLERAELLAAAEDRRTAQARRARMVILTRGDAFDESAGAVVINRWEVTVTNNSDEPLQDMNVQFGDAYTAASAVELDSRHLPGAGRRTLPVDVLAPGRRVCFASPQFSEATVHNNRPVVSFTDAAGHRWTLDEHGTLTPQPSQPGP